MSEKITLTIALEGETPLVTIYGDERANTPVKWRLTDLTGFEAPVATERFTANDPNGGNYSSKYARKLGKLVTLKFSIFHLRNLAGYEALEAINGITDSDKFLTLTMETEFSDGGKVKQTLNNCYLIGAPEVEKAIGEYRVTLLLASKDYKLNEPIIIPAPVQPAWGGDYDAADTSDPRNWTSPTYDPSTDPNNPDSPTYNPDAVKPTYSGEYDILDKKDPRNWTSPTHTTEGDPNNPESPKYNPDATKPTFTGDKYDPDNEDDWTNWTSKKYKIEDDPNNPESLRYDPNYIYRAEEPVVTWSQPAWGGKYTNNRYDPRNWRSNSYYREMDDPNNPAGYTYDLNYTYVIPTKPMEIPDGLPMIIEYKGGSNWLATNGYQWMFDPHNPENAVGNYRPKPSYTGDKWSSHPNDPRNWIAEYYWDLVDPNNPDGMEYNPNYTFPPISKPAWFTGRTLAPDDPRNWTSPQYRPDDDPSNPNGFNYLGEVTLPSYGGRYSILQYDQRNPWGPNFHPDYDPNNPNGYAYEPHYVPYSYY